MSLHKLVLLGKSLSEKSSARKLLNHATAFNILNQTEKEKMRINVEILDFGSILL